MFAGVRTSAKIRASLFLWLAEMASVGFLTCQAVNCKDFALNALRGLDKWPKKAATIFTDGSGKNELVTDYNSIHITKFLINFKNHVSAININFEFPEFLAFFKGLFNYPFTESPVLFYLCHEVFIFPVFQENVV